jgi:hypothetical protein
VTITAEGQDKDPWVAIEKAKAAVVARMEDQ